MENVKNVLITGGSGMIGTRLTELLLDKGYHVACLGRKIKTQPVKTFLWNIDEQRIEENAFRNVHTIVHLAGELISDKRWTKKRKQEILESRTKSTRLLRDELNKRTHNIKNFISASGATYYGFGGGEKGFVESDRPAEDFLSKVTVAWENEVDKIATLGLRVVKIRASMVLSEQGGALKKFAGSVKLMAGAALGSGKQCLSWIHIDDLCNIYIKSIEDNSMEGVYNAAAPHPVTNKTFIHVLAKVLHKPLFLPNVPAFFLKVIFGEMADFVLNESRISSKKIQNKGFNFQFKTLESALRNLYLVPKSRRKGK